jgi:hypothetical protein
MLELFTSFVAGGADELDFWSTMYNATSLGNYRGELQAAGTLFQIMSHDLIGTRATDVPVASANVTYAGQTQITNATGQASLDLPIGKPAVVTVVHAAFAPFSQTITAQPNGLYELTLTEKPSVTIKTKTNETHIVDIGTAQFANAAIFSNPTRSDTGNFCKEDGSDFTPDKTEFTRIIGPGVLETASQCCQFGKVISANAEMKSGAHLKIYFKDSCSGNEVDFVGREKSTGLYQYFRFTDIAEIDFP